MNKEEIKQEPNDGLIARILGGTPTILQKVFFINTALNQYLIVCKSITYIKKCL